VRVPPRLPFARRTPFGRSAACQSLGADENSAQSGPDRREYGAAVVQGQAFKGRQFTDEVILWAVRWYLMFPISYRDLELMPRDRGVTVDHTTIFRWIQDYAAEPEKRIRPHLRLSNGPGVWTRPISR
jgi:hypothetical protein